MPDLVSQHFYLVFATGSNVGAALLVIESGLIQTVYLSFVVLYILLQSKNLALVSATEILLFFEEIFVGFLGFVDLQLELSF